MGVAPDPGGWHIRVYGGCAAGFGVSFVSGPEPVSRIALFATGHRSTSDQRGI
jgi:hypothetical protein